MHDGLTKFEICALKNVCFIDAQRYVTNVLLLAADTLAPDDRRAKFSIFDAHVYSMNNIFLGIASPEYCLQRPVHSTQCTAWVALSKHGIIGLIRRWQRARHDSEHRALPPGPKKVLGSSWPKKRCC